MALINNRNPTEHHNDPHSNCSHQRKSFTEDYTKHFFIERQGEYWKSVSKRSKKRIIISTETNHIPRRPVQNLMTLPIYLNKISYWSMKVSPTRRNTALRRVKYFKIDFSRTTNVSLVPPNQPMLEWYPWVIHKWSFTSEQKILRGKYFLQHPILDEVSQSAKYFLQRTFPGFPHNAAQYITYTYIGISTTSQITQIIGFANRVNGLREGVGEYSAEYSSYSRNKPFTPILPVRTIFSPILYLPARPDLSLYYS